MVHIINNFPMWFAVVVMLMVPISAIAGLFFLCYYSNFSFSFLLLYHSFILTHDPHPIGSLLPSLVWWGGGGVIVDAF